MAPSSGADIRIALSARFMQFAVVDPFLLQELDGLHCLGAEKDGLPRVVIRLPRPHIGVEGAP